MRRHGLMLFPGNRNMTTLAAGVSVPANDSQPCRGSSSAKTGTMKKQLLIVTDLGSFKAYAVDNSPLHSTPRLELIEHYTPEQPLRKMADKRSVLAGRS